MYGRDTKAGVIRYNKRARRRRRRRRVYNHNGVNGVRFFGNTARVVIKGIIAQCDVCTCTRTRTCVIFRV